MRATAPLYSDTEGLHFRGPFQYLALATWLYMYSRPTSGLRFRSTQRGAFSCSLLFHYIKKYKKYLRLFHFFPHRSLALLPRVRWQCGRLFVRAGHPGREQCQLVGKSGKDELSFFGFQKTVTVPMYYICTNPAACSFQRDFWRGERTKKSRKNKI